MLLQTTFFIDSTGSIKYDCELSGRGIPLGESGAMEHAAMTKVAAAIKDSVDELNKQLIAEGITEKLANR